MLGGDDHAAETAFFEQRTPLTAVELCRVEAIGRLAAVSPFGAGEGIHVEVHKRIELPLVPCQLLRRRNCTVRGRRSDGRSGVCETCPTYKEYQQDSKEDGDRVAVATSRPSGDPAG